MNELKLDVPFFVQETNTDCGPTAIKMILNYFNVDESKSRLNDLACVEKSGAALTLGLAKAFGELGFKTEFYTSSLDIDPDFYKTDFYKTHGDGFEENLTKIASLKSACIAADVKLIESHLSLDDFLSKLSIDCVALALLDWNVVRDNHYGSYNGHFVPVVGFDSDSVYVHNQGLSGSSAYMEISRVKFDKARKAFGTDEEVIFVHRS